MRCARPATLLVFILAAWCGPWNAECEIGRALHVLGLQPDKANPKP